MDAVKRYLLRNFEHVFVLLVLVSTAVINYFIPAKLAFLNFYFLPVILGAYYLGRRMAVLGAFMCLLMVVGYVLLQPEAFLLEPTETNIYVHVAVWGSFLILAGAVVGRLQEKLTGEMQTTRDLNQSLATHQESLNRANVELRDYSDNLEKRVQERTVELEESKISIESLKKKVETALYTTMDSSVVNLMIEGRLRNEKRAMSVMFADLVGFTTYSERTPPENVVAELNRYLADMEPVLFAYHGHIDKYMGDGIMCEFGAPLDFATHRLMAVMAATKMQEVLARRDYPWKMRIGLASGSAITGLIGSRRQTYTAIGDVVNLAARLEQQCAPGHVLVDRYTFEDVSRFFDARKVHTAPPGEKADVDNERELERLHAQLVQTPEAADVLFKVGELYLQLNDAVEAASYLERAVRLDRSNTQYMLAYAEAGLRVKEDSSITVKGRRQRVEAYVITGMKDPLADNHRIPDQVYEMCAPVIDDLNISSDLTLPTEVLDGSVGHSRIVAALSYALAGRLGLVEREKLNVARAGFVADVGKEIIPPYILNRRGGLTSSEHDIVKQHPQEACEIMRKMGYDEPQMLAMVRHSHERFDGTGYPDRLSGAAIPIGSRIIAVADAYEALTGWRVHREPWERSAALGEIKSGAEKGAFDPTVVQAFTDILSESSP